MANKVKTTIERLKQQKALNKKINVTMSIEKVIYDKAKAHLEEQGLKISEVVEAFLREVLEKD